MLINIHSFRGFWNHATSHIIHQQRYKWPSTYFHNLVGLSLPLHDISLNYVVVSDWLFSKDTTNHLGYDEVFINEIWFAGKLYLWYQFRYIKYHLYFIFIYVPVYFMSKLYNCPWGTAICLYFLCLSGNVQLFLQSSNIFVFRRSYW